MVKVLHGFRIAAHLIAWKGEQHKDPEKVLRQVAGIGYDGVEGLVADSPAEMIELASLAARYGLHIVNFGGPTPEATARYNAVLGNRAVEIPACSRSAYGSRDVTPADFGRAADDLKGYIELAYTFNLKPYHHAHVGTMIETREDAGMLLERTPGLYLLFDTGHLLAAGSDPLAVLQAYASRIAHVHLKDFYAESKPYDHTEKDFWQNNRFAELGAGNTGLNAMAILEGLRNVGYDGWISVELDHPRYEPHISMKMCFDYLESLQEK